MLWKNTMLCRPQEQQQQQEAAQGEEE